MTVSASIEDMLLELHEYGIKLSVTEGRLVCDAPKGALTSELRDQIANNKVQLVAYIERKTKRISESEIPNIQVYPRDKAIPLSFAQQRMWFMAQIEGTNPTYNVPTSIQLTGDLNLTALEQAFNKMIARHESLRTCFIQGYQAQPEQRIYESFPFNMPVVDLRHLDSHSKTQRLTEQLTELSAWPFNLSELPLFIAYIYRLEDQHSVLFLNLHHIISDGWSLGLMVTELTHFYRHACHPDSAVSPLPPLDYQYADYAVWQREYLTGSRLEKLTQYWQTQLADSPPLLEVPTDKPRTPQTSFAGQSIHFLLDRNTTDRLHAVCKQQGATLFMALLTCYGILLSRYSGQDDIAIGTTIANRNHSFTESMLGFFVNTLVLRLQLNPYATFKEVLLATKAVCLGAYEHQDMPFEQLVEIIQPERNLSHTPLFQAMLMLQNAPAGDMNLPGLTVAPMSLENHFAHFDLNMSLTETTTGLDGILEFRTDLFNTATIERMLRHFVKLVSMVAKQPGHCIGSLSLLSASEIRQILGDWNQTEQVYDREKTISQLFEEQVLRQPNAIALCYRHAFDSTDGELQWTYNELNQRANQLAHHLIQLGVGPEHRVAVFLERSPLMVVAVLGILKAGGAYIPIHHTWPIQRATHILLDQGVEVLITQPLQWALARDIAESTQHERDAGGITHLVCLADDEAQLPQDLNNEEHPAAYQCWWPRQLSGYSRDNPNLPLASHSTAYIIFTSGSTGAPKGVVLKHQPVVNVIQWVNKQFSVGPHDRLLFVTSICFDLSVYDIFGILAAGASLRIASETDLDNPENLVSFLESGEITLWDSAPAALQQLTPLFSEANTDALNRLRLVFLSGDWIPLTLPDTIREHFPRTQAVSLGGATEAAIWSNFHIIQKIEPHWSSIPYGRPIQNARYYILDNFLNPCPIGVVGELHIGGECLASGYTSDAQTAKQFIPDPFVVNTTSGVATMYKTGDLARFWADGTIEIMGRLDHQVKLRGYRIETGEIEAVLVSSGAINKALVVLRDDLSSVKQLVAYVVPNKEMDIKSELQESLIQDLRQQCRVHLPDYMIPTAFVMLAQLPITSNGKVDRKALPRPQQTTQPQAIAPSTPLERRLCHIWQTVLGVANVGINDNFFDLGGDSIISIQIVSRAREEGLKMIARQIFQYQTIAELAPHITELEKEVSLAQDTEENVEEPLVIPLTPIQYWLFSQELAKPNHFNQSFLFSIETAVDSQCLEQAVRALISQHPVLRVGFEKVGEQWRQIQRPLGEVLESDDYYHYYEVEPSVWPTQIEQLCNRFQSSFDLAKPPLLRVALFRHQVTGESRLLVLFHHLVVDGVSWRMVLQDLTRAYEHYLAMLKNEDNSTLRLPEPLTSIRQWSSQLQQYAQQQDVLDELDFWRAYLSQIPQAMLPTDYSTKSDDTTQFNTVSTSATIVASLNESDTLRLLHQTSQAYNTRINEILLAALWQTFSEWTRASHIRVDMESHGREERVPHCDVSRTLGWFTSIYPVVMNLPDPSRESEEETLAFIIKNIKEQFRKIPNQGFHYGLLRYLASPEIVDELALLPKSEVSFNYLGQLDTSLNDVNNKKSGLFDKAAEENPGQVHAPKNQRPYLLDIGVSIMQGQLSCHWLYNTQVHKAQTIEQLAQNFIGNLTRLIDHCCSIDTTNYTPSDFSAVDLEQDELDAVLDELDLDF